MERVLVRTRKAADINTWTYSVVLDYLKQFTGANDRQNLDLSVNVARYTTFPMEPTLFTLSTRNISLRSRQPFFAAAEEICKRVQKAVNMQ